MNASHIRTLLCLLPALLLASGCGGPAPQIRPVHPAAVVVAFGDSLTAGSGAGPEQAYPAVLAAALGCPVINEGVPGEVTAQGLRRLPRVLRQYQPQLVILCHGGNDLLQRVPPAEIKRNLAQMLRLLKEAQVDVVLVGVPQPSLTLATARFYKELAREFALPYDGDTLKSILKRAPLKSDAIHPNAEGYAILAGAIAQLIHAAAGQ